MFAVSTITLLTVTDTKEDPVQSVTSTDGTLWYLWSGAAEEGHSWYAFGVVAPSVMVTVTRRSGRSESQRVDHIK